METKNYKNCANCGRIIKGGWKSIGGRYYHHQCEIFARKIQS